MHLADDVPAVAARWRPGRPGDPPAAEVQVWLFDLDHPPLPLAGLRALLSPEEEARAARFRFAVHRRRFAAGRGLLRAALGRLLDRDPARIELAYGEKGKPRLADPAPDLRFNLSHSANAALLAVARGRDLGVDVEAVRPMADASELVERFFAPGERELFRRFPPELRDLGFFRGWTCKEAYVKARGDGLSLPTTAFELAFAAEELPPRLVRFDQQPEEVGRWSFAALDPAAGFVGALAVEGADPGGVVGRFWC